jgi:hypothetical protein
MPRAFDITAVTDSIRLGATGKGEVAFTVSNALRAPMRARASVVPGAGAKAEWFTLAGDAERDFPPDGTQQFTVQVHAPPGTPPGRLTFHLLVVDVTDPDERYAEGPSTGFEVVAAPPPKKPFPWMWVALAAGVVLILGTVIGILSSRGGEGEGEKAPELAKLGEPCPDGVCDQGLACTAADGGVCMMARGGPCDGGTQCLTGFCDRQGRCELALGQTCQGEASCPGPLKCTPVLGSRLCLLKPGEECGSDRDCSSFFCATEGRCNRDDGRCDSNAQCREPSVCGPSKLCQFPNGQRCTGNEVCLSGFCSNTTCQPTPVASQCAGPCPPFSACVRGLCVIVRDHRINQDVLMGSSETRQQLQQLQLQQNLQR